MNKERSAHRPATILTVVIGALVVPLCGLVLWADSQVMAGRPQPGPPVQIPGITVGAGQAVPIGEAGPPRQVGDAPSADRAPQVQRIVDQPTETSAPWLVLLSLAFIVGGGLVVRALRAQQRRIRSLETKLNGVEMGLTAKVETIEERLRRESEHGRLRERI